MWSGISSPCARTATGRSIGCESVRLVRFTLSVNEVPPVPKNDVVVWVVMQDGARYESEPRWASTADHERHAILAHRDRRLNYERYDVPRWLPDDFDPSKAADVGVRVID